MGKQKLGLTFEEHQELGAKLHQIRETLLREGIKVANKYPHAAKVSKLALEAHKVIDRLRSELDDQICREHPSMDSHTSIKTYYPGGSRNQDEG